MLKEEPATAPHCPHQPTRSECVSTILFASWFRPIDAHSDHAEIRLMSALETILARPGSRHDQGSQAIE